MHGAFLKLFKNRKIAWARYEMKNNKNTYRNMEL